MRTRAAIGAGLAAVFWATLSAPCLAQDVVKFPATDSDRPYQVYLRGELLKPQGPGPFPAVVLMHGCGGWQPAVHYALEAHAEFLSEHGFAVLDLDSFGPRHDAANAMCASDARLRRALVYLSLIHI